MTINPIHELAKASGFEVTIQRTISGASSILEPIPSHLHSSVFQYLQQEYPYGLYAHQVASINLILHGHDVCLATSTASGKSLAFMSSAAHLLLENPEAKVLAIYPARALVEDQLGKWSRFLDSMGIRVGRIDGGVKVAERTGILTSSRVLVMTPDIVHAWLMSRVGEQEIADFIQTVRLLVLDEAHVYDGVFGTNMAYLMRRLRAITNRFQLFASTATIGNPRGFIENLTGRSANTIGQDQDASDRAQKNVVVLSGPANSFSNTASLLALLAKEGTGIFLAFGDSRRGVEQVVSAIHRDHSDLQNRVLPYRAGYEARDRREIQAALTKGELKGVVSTSALELGLDIGTIDAVVLLSSPPSIKSFWQRLGRAGRVKEADCYVLDADSSIQTLPDGVDHYLSGVPEPNHLYMENRYLQYANALCAAHEHSTGGATIVDRFESVPNLFKESLRNEIEPTQEVPADLYELKQRAQGGPHYEFPLRTGVEKEFQIKGPHDQDLGTVSFPQLLREAYPGAIYYYMATPYRVTVYRYRDGEVRAKRESRWTTSPIQQTTVFPNFQSGLLQMCHSTSLFVAEAEVQVAERLSGFSETHGSTKETHKYEPGSPHHQRPIDRFFRTTGVAWHIADLNLSTESIAKCLLEAFCLKFGIQEQDLGVGRFYSKSSPLNSLQQVQGFCIYDGAHGSLRLTEPLVASLREVASHASDIADRRGESKLADSLRQLADLAKDLKCTDGNLTTPELLSVQQDWVEVIADGEPAMVVTIGGAKEITVVTHRYTPQGLMYEFVEKPGMTSRIPKDKVEPLAGVTKTVWVNLMTGEIVDQT